jgi:SAM-dependent methyltransferase
MRHPADLGHARRTHLRKPSPDANPTPDQLRDFFFDLYADAPQLLRTLSACRPYVCPFDSIVRFVPKQARILDFGCGTGAVLALLAAMDRVEHGVGCDISEFAVDVARVAARQLGTARLEFLKIADLRDVPSGVFNVVLMVDVLHHIPEGRRSEAIAIAARRIAPGGVFIYKDMTDRPLWRRWAHTLDDLIFAHEFVHQVPPKRVEEWAHREGLTLEHAEYLPRLVYGNILRVFRKQ